MAATSGSRADCRLSICGRPGDRLFADPRLADRSVGVLALAHAGKAHVLMREAAHERPSPPPKIWGSSGQTEAAIAAVHKHFSAWPLDALVISIAANPNGLIGGSGRLGQKHQIAELMDSVAPHYGKTSQHRRSAPDALRRFP